MIFTWLPDLADVEDQAADALAGVDCSPGICSLRGQDAFGAADACTTSGAAFEALRRCR